MIEVQLQEIKRYIVGLHLFSHAEFHYISNLVRGQRGIAKWAATAARRGAHIFAQNNTARKTQSLETEGNSLGNSDSLVLRF